MTSTIIRSFILTLTGDLNPEGTDWMEMHQIPEMRRSVGGGGLLEASRPPHLLQSSSNDVCVVCRVCIEHF
jgi:hypothetical protein